MSLLIFSHANSFPASTYNVLFESLGMRGYTVKALEKFGHDPRYPVTDNWPHIVQELADFAKPFVEKAGEPAWLVGHSLGGYLSQMAAALHPELARGVVLIDSPLVGGWRSSALGVMKSTRGNLSRGSASSKRRHTWPSLEAAFEHFRHKKAFAKWNEQMLWDYVTHGTAEVDGQRVLTFDRSVETLFYNTLPHNMEGLLTRHPPKCPTSFIGGCNSPELIQAGMAMTEKITRGRTMMLEGSHLFPMENPLATAAAIEASLRSMAR